jgi:guanylate kinase
VAKARAAKSGASAIPAVSGRDLVVLSGPSGAGKTTVCHALAGRVDLVLSTSATTRKPRPDEVDGKDYYFLAPEDFRRRIAEGRFVEWAEVFGQYYGTPVEEMARAARQGKRLLLEIDVQGGIQIKKKFQEALAILLLVPNEKTQRERLSRRGTETPEEIERRFQKAQEEVRMARASHVYDVEVVNDDLERTIQDVARIIQARRKQA